MQPTVKDINKDPARPAKLDPDEKATADHDSDDRLNKMADEMAGRGMNRERKDEEGNIFSK